MLIPPSWGQCCSVLLTKYGESLVGTAPLGSGVAVWACVWGYPGCLPLSGGPSGDFELPEEETTQPDTANEVVAVGGAAAKPSAPSGTLPKGVRPGPGLLDNAIDSGSSAAQLPQKSILERKEVLVGEAWALDFATWEEL
jgi:hypothetical protein